MAEFAIDNTCPLLPGSTIFSFLVQPPRIVARQIASRIKTEINDFFIRTDIGFSFILYNYFLLKKQPEVSIPWLFQLILNNARIILIFLSSEFK
jgi:hypothetical protein